MNMGLVRLTCQPSQAEELDLVTLNLLATLSAEGSIEDFEDGGDL